MKFSSKTLLVACCVAFSGVSLGQEHAISYNKKNRAVDSMVTIAGVPHKMVRLPVRDFQSGDKYAVIFPARSIGGLFTTGFITTSHSSGPFESNEMIDGFPASVIVADGITYSVSSDGLGGHEFLVVGDVTVTVTIDFGNTLATLFTSLEIPNPGTGTSPITAVEIGPSANAVPHAKWNKYKDPTTLVNGLDKWLDFIRISQL